MRSPLALAVVAPLLAGVPGGRLMAQSSPQTVAQHFFGALEGRRWRDAAALIDPQQLVSYRDETLAMLVALIQQREELRRMPAQGSGALVPLSSDGKLDPEALARVGDTPLPAVPGVRTLRDLAALPPAEFLARLLEASDLRSLERSGGRIDSLRRRILGAVAEGDSVAHVVYRLEGAGVRYDDPYHVEGLATVRRGDRWYVRRRHHDDFGSPSFVMMRLVEPDTGRK